MDEVDRANSEAERALAQALRKRRPDGPAPTGQCLYCDDDVAAGRRWCGAECREAWEKEVRRGR